MPVPCNGRIKALDALHEGMEVYMVGVMGDANLQTCWSSIQLAHRIRGEPNWDVRNYINV